MVTVTTCISFTFTVLLATAFLYLTCEGGAICYECDSKANNCTPESLGGVIQGACSRDNDYCAVYKKEPPGDSSLHQYARYCGSECEQYNTTYTTGKFQKTRHCILCCRGDLCNNYLIDPCNPPSTALRLKCEMLMVAMLSVLAVKI